MSAFKVSVITVCYNAAATLEKTIVSVLSQTYPHLEYIIVDGHSTDATMGIIAKYKDRIHKVVSEKDKGIYDAMNKGLGLASGDVIYFLNADDSFFDPHVVTDVVTAFEQDESCLLFYGKVRFSEVPAYYQPYVKETLVIQSPKDFLAYTICHQAIFAKRTLFDQVGNFDCTYRYSADYDWQIRAYLFNPEGFKFLDREVCHYHYVGSSYQHLSQTRKENTRIRFRRLLSLECCWRYLRYDVLRGLKKKLLNEKY